MITVDGFQKSYRDVIAVDDLSFDVRPGAILGLIGPNGAGKTTTLRAIAGIIPPTRGSLAVAGHDVAMEPVEAKLRLACIPDEPRLFESLTVNEHLDFIASAYRVDGAAEKATRLLETFELTEKKNTIAQELSRGMRQKVAICCAYLHDPAAILFDEPLTGLDPHGIRTLKSSIVARANAGAAVIVSSHLLALVEDLCTHLLILDRGRRRFFGSIDEARAAYASMSGDKSLEEIFFQATAAQSTQVGSASPQSEG
jgi:ABC-2 type transport system ATP-binding protein